MSTETLNAMDSSALLKAAQAGDGESFWILCEPLQDRLIRQAFALCRNEAQAQDLSQETLVAAWNSIGQFKGGCQLFTWLCCILLNKHRSAMRRAKWAGFFGLRSDYSEEDLETSATPIQPDIAAELSEQSSALLEMLNELPSLHRDVLFLRFYAGESLEGIAVAMNCSVGTVKSRLFNGLEKLRKKVMVRKDFQ